MFANENKSVNKQDNFEKFILFTIKNVFQKNIILKKMDLYKNPRPHIYVENINGNTDKI